MYAAIEQAIIARLRERLDAGIKVLTLADLAEVPDNRQKTPAVFVVYEGFSPAATSANVPHVQQVEQTWSVVVACRNARGAGGSAAAREDVSEIAQEVLQALLGFMAQPGVRLSLSGAPGPEYDGGFAYLPIGFSCRSTFKGSA